MILRKFPSYALALVCLLTRERSDGTSHVDSDMMTPRRARVWSVPAPGPGELPEPCPPWLWPLLLLHRLSGWVSHFSDMSSQGSFSPEVLVYCSRWAVVAAHKKDKANGEMLLGS